MRGRIINNPANSRDYYISVATTKKDIPSEFKTLVIPASNWVVFKTSGPQPETLLRIWERIYAEWFPSSGYEFAESIEFVCDLNDATEALEFEYEIWIPVKRK